MLVQLHLHLMIPLYDHHCGDFA